MPAYVVMYGDSPREVALVLWTAQANALAFASKYDRDEARPEYRWDEHRTGTWRLLNRSPGRKRFAWTYVAVHEVPLAEETELAEVSGA